MLGSGWIGVPSAGLGGGGCCIMLDELRRDVVDDVLAGLLRQDGQGPLDLALRRVVPEDRGTRARRACRCAGACGRARGPPPRAATTSTCRASRWRRASPGRPRSSPSGARRTRSPRTRSYRRAPRRPCQRRDGHPGARTRLAHRLPGSRAVRRGVCPAHRPPGSHRARCYARRRVSGIVSGS